jgi:hypothetical protein
MNRRPAALVAVAVLALAGCGGRNAATSGQSNAEATTAPSAEASMPTAVLGKPFRNGSFEVTVTRVSLGVKLIDVDALQAKSDPWAKAYVPQNGQFIMVYAKATNVGNAPATMSSTASILVDADGKQYAAAGGFYVTTVPEQGFETDQQPGTTRTGWFAFDVPASVTAVNTLEVQSDPVIATTNPSSSVKIS